MAKPKGGRKSTEASAAVTADVAKRSFGELIARAGFGKERIVITRHGKPLAALVSAQDLAALTDAA